MTFWGVGPRFVLISAISFLIAVGLHYRYPDLFGIDCIPYHVLLVVGLVLITLGLTLLMTAGATITRGFKAGKLCTTGAYALCRHPIYATWVVFLVPGIALLVGSWLCMALTLVMYVLLRVLVRKEETYLEQTFGDRYRKYRRRVPAVFPLGWFSRK